TGWVRTSAPVPAAPRVPTAGQPSIVPTRVASRWRSAMVLVAVGALDRPVAARLERHLSSLPATRAGGAQHLRAPRLVDERCSLPRSAVRAARQSGQRPGGLSKPRLV